MDKVDDPYRTKLRAAWTAEDVRRAVRDGEDLDAVNREEEQWTMLMWAAAREEADGEALLRAMISAGADVEKKSAGGSTALMWAARAGVRMPRHRSAHLDANPTSDAYARAEPTEPAHLDPNALLLSSSSKSLGGGDVAIVVNPSVLMCCNAPNVGDAKYDYFDSLRGMVTSEQLENDVIDFVATVLRQAWLEGRDRSDEAKVKHEEMCARL